MSDADKLPQFWLLVKSDYPSLSDKAVKVLLPFVITFMGIWVFCCCCHENKWQ